MMCLLQGPLLGLFKLKNSSDFSHPNHHIPIFTQIGLFQTVFLKASQQIIIFPPVLPSPNPLIFGRSFKNNTHHPKYPSKRVSVFVLMPVAILFYPHINGRNILILEYLSFILYPSTHRIDHDCTNTSL